MSIRQNSMAARLSQTSGGVRNVLSRYADKESSADLGVQLIRSRLSYLCKNTKKAGRVSVKCVWKGPTRLSFPSFVQLCLSGPDTDTGSFVGPCNCLCHQCADVLHECAKVKSMCQGRCGKSYGFPCSQNHIERETVLFKMHTDFE